MEATFESIANVISDIADIPLEEIQENSRLIDDLDLSSLEILSIFSDISAMFSVEISEEEVLKVVTVKDIIDAVNR